MVLQSVRPRHWLFAALISGNLLFAAVLSTALWNSRQQETELQLRIGQNLALAIERSVSGTFDKIDFALQGVADTLDQQLARGAIDHRAMVSEITRLAKRLPEIEVLRYADANGEVVAESGYPAGNKAISVADRDYFLALKNTPQAAMLTSKPVLGRTSNKWVIAFARRLQHADGRFAGVVYAAVTLNHFTDVFQQLQIGRQGIVAIVDPDYAIVARYPAPPDPKLLGQRVPQDEIVELLKSGQPTFSRVLQARTDGVERSYSFHRLATRPYHVAVGLSTDEAYAKWWQQLALAVAVLLAFAGITVFGSCQLLRSWQRQAAANRQVTLEKDRYRALNQELEARVEQRTQDLLQANQELKQALDHLGNSEKLAALGSLVAGVTHELNTPIGNLRLGASTYKERIEELSAELAQGNIRRSTLARFMADGQELVRLLDRNAERAAEMIASFKTVAVDQSSNRRRSFDLQKTVDDVLSTMRQQLRRGHCQVTNAIPSGVMLDSYPGALMQIVGNLLENALLHAFAGRDDGALVIDLPSISETEVSLSFADNGPGIPAAVAERIFEPFYSTRIGQGGSGLGLHLVRQIVGDPLGGTIELERDDHPSRSGATFMLRLPRCAPQPPAAPPERLSA